MQDEAYAAEEVPPTQDVEEISEAGSETAQEDSAADISDAETRPKPQQVIMHAQDQRECGASLGALPCCTCQ